MNPEIIKLLKEESLIFRSTIHGLSHWKGVERNGLYLARFSGADSAVISYFAYFHDCMRVRDENEPGHGWKGADFAKEHRELIGLEDAQFRILYDACRWHENENCTGCVTINTCRDADRLDLWRVGIKPDPDLLFTNEAKRIACITASQEEIDSIIGDL